MGAAGAVAQDEAMIARHQAHEAHHGWAKRRGYAAPDGTRGSGPPVVSSLPSGRTVTAADYACQATSILVARLGLATPVAAADGSLIFTDYSLRVELLLKGRPPSVVTRVGGEIAGDAPRRFRSQLLPMLVPEERYLLFLSPVAGSDALASDFPGGTLRLLPSGDAEQVDGVSFVRGVPKSGQTMPTATLVTEIRRAVAAGCLPR